MKRTLKNFLSLVLIFSIVFSLSSIGFAISPSHFYGDVNNDGQVDMKDVLVIRMRMCEMRVSPYNAKAADVNEDSQVDMKDVLLIRQHLAHMIELGSFEETTSTTTTKLSPKYPIDSNNPRINFIKDSSASLGVWWWHQETDSMVDTYLQFMEENQVTEIYYYCAHLLSSGSNREIVHKFVQKAMAHNMRVAALFDVQNVVKEGNQSFVGATDDYLTYCKEYPQDAMYGLHCDIEPQASDRKNDETWQNWFQGFTTYFLGQVDYARKQNVWVEIDIGCGWDSLSKKVKYSLGLTDRYKEMVDPVPNEDGTYDLRLFDAIANACDTMCMMSYRDTAEEILRFAATGRKAADKAGTRIIYGVETGNDNEGPQVDFYADSKEIMYRELSKLLVLLENDSPIGNYGFAIHYTRMWYSLRDTL